MEGEIVKIFFVKSAEVDNNILINKVNTELDKKHLREKRLVRRLKIFLSFEIFENNTNGVRDLVSIKY